MAPPPAPPITRGRKAAAAEAEVVAATPTAVEEVDAGSITADQFWRAFVSKRRPALIRGLLHGDPAFRKLERWKDDAHLIACAGDEQVEVERAALREVAATASAAMAAGPSSARANGRPAAPPPQQRAVFGLGDRTRMTLREFLERRARGEPLYLSTQTHPRAPEDGAPDVHGPPLRRTPLCGEAPLVPALLSPLVPQAINVWISSAPPPAPAATSPAPTTGSTSGLHHDYHDNLYLLLRGAKRFRLWPQSCVAGMYPHGGAPAAVHASGRIVYGGAGGDGGGGENATAPCSVLPDGTDAAEAARWRRRWDAERAVAAAEGRARRREPGAREALRAAEAALEAELEADLDERMGLGGKGPGKRKRRTGGKDGGGGDDDDDEDEDDEDEDEGDLDLLEGMRDDYDELCGGDDDGGGGEDGGPHDDDGGDDCDGEEDEDEDEEQHQGAGAGEGPSPPPPSFSRIDLSPYPADDDDSPEAARRADAELRAIFPLFPGLASALSARVGEGDALFLPAGWFHEVTTYGAAPGGGGSSSSSSGGGSFALNYWFYPPDALDKGPPPAEDGGAVLPGSSPPPSLSPSSSPSLRLRPLWPYRASGGFLPELWRRRLEWLAPRHAAMRALADAIANKVAAGGSSSGGAKARAQRLACLRKQLQTQQASAPEGGRSPLLRFHARVPQTNNRYRTSTTRPGSASGDPTVPPRLSAERRERLGLPPPEEDEDEDEDDDEYEETDDGADDDDEEDEEEEEEQDGGEAGGQAAFRAMLKANPDLARQLLARLAMQQQQHGGGPGAGAAAGRRRPTRAERALFARQRVWLTHGRRHHLAAGGWRGRDWGWGGRRPAGEGCETRGEVKPAAGARAAAGTRAAAVADRKRARDGDVGARRKKK